MKTVAKTLKNSLWIALLAVCFVFPTSLYAESDNPITLRISSAVGDKHAWVAGHMEPFADKIEQRTKGKIEFQRFVAGELVKAGNSLDALRGRSIDVAAPFLAPYHSGEFPLTDVTMLPVMGTTSVEAARAFRKLVNSDVPLKDGKTFYELEIESKGLVAWPLAPTDAYIISTTGKRFDSVEDIKGTPLRGGARAHLLFIEALGATAVDMPAVDAYEAFSRGTLDGAVYSIPDWKAYGFTEVFEYNITGISIGHWPSYLAVTKATWDRLPADVQEIWDETAKEMVMENAEYWISMRNPTIEEAKEEYNSVFEDVENLDPEVQEAIYDASVETWKLWIEREEKKGNPARATAELWAELIVQEGGELPEGVEEYLSR